MSPVSATIPTAIASATLQPSIISANAMTSISTMLSSTMVTVIQPALSTVPTATVYTPEPQSTASASSSAPRQWIPEPYNSIIMFIAAVAGIIYLFGYTFPHTRKNIIKWFRRKKIRAEQLFKKREEKEEKREKKEAKREEEMAMVETRTYQVHQMQSVENLVNGQHAQVEESKGIRESVEKVATGVQVLPKAMMDAMAEVIKGAVKEGYENGAKDAMKGMEEIITKAVTKGTKEGIKDAMREVNQTTSDGMERVVTAVQGMEGVLKVGFEAVETRIRGIEYRVDWMLDYHLDENERIHALKAILPGLLKQDDSTSTASSSTPWGGDLVENRVIVDEGDWEDHKKPWEKQ